MNLSRIAAVTGLCLLTACDIPTDAPIIDQRWVVPIETTTISVSQLLPSGVTINGTRFAVNVGGLSSTQSLGTACPGCGPLNGQTAPVPAFNFSTTTAPTNLPNLVTGADLASGTLNISVQNGFSFDPTTGGGSVTITVRESGGRTIGSSVITGLPAGQTTTRSIALVAGAVGTSLTATVVIDSKGASATQINTAQQITVTATPAAILVNSANVNVSSKAFNVDQQDLDVSDIDEDVTDKIEEGSIVLDVTNPFGVAMSGSLRITAPGTPVLTKPFSITTATAKQEVRLTFTKDELNSFLGKDNVTLTGSGSIAGSAGTITVTPVQTVQLKAKLDVKIRIGS